MRRISLALAVVVLALGLATAPRHLQSLPAASPNFTHFESGQVHPVAMTPDNARLLVVNTPDGYLSVFSLTEDTIPRRQCEIAVGLEPVSVCALNDSIAWVVNQVSDDVSIVNLNLRHTVGTLRVGDEPGDVVFAAGKAYVSVGQEDAVKVYDPVSRALLSTIRTPGRVPRALARDGSGSRVYVTSLMAGNRTSVLSSSEVPTDSVPEDFDMPMDGSLPPAPHTGLIVQQQGNNWFDMYGNLWNSKAKYNVPDNDVSEIATATDAISRSFGGIGSTIFNVAVNPVGGNIAALGTEGRNLLRFEPRLSGYLVETNIGFVNFTSGLVTARKLNPHIDYDIVPGTQAEVDSAIGIPTGLAFTQDGQRCYVTSLANDKIALVNPSGGLLTTVKARIPCVAGPTGIVLDEARRHIYVVGRFHNQIQTLNMDTFQQSALWRIGYDPTPDAIVNGRKFFYGGFTSAHGDQSCATCHVFGDLDGLAWDLGDPFGSYVNPPVPNPLGLAGFHPMKGPMTTQTLRGMTNTEPLHWRGDRTNLGAFNNAFISLMGRGSVLPDSEMTAFSAFTMPLVDPPNPNQYLDRSFRDAPPGAPSAVRGRDFFFNTPVFSGRTCESCHSESNFGPGTNRQMVHRDTILEVQDLKVPQLRNLYRKGGFRDSVGATSARGFGYSHDGSDDNIFRFLHRPQFQFDPNPVTADEQRRDMAAYIVAFDTGMSPAVGFELTFDGTNGSDPTALGRVDTLKSQADLNYCDVIARGRVAGQPRGWWYLGGDLWRPDKAAESDVSTATMLALAGPGSELTVLGVPKGEGERRGLDRDNDGFLGGDEVAAGSDPGNPASTPANVGIEPGTPKPATFALRAVAPNPFRSFTDVTFTLGRPGRVDMVVYDVLGREVRAVARGQWFPAGNASLRWDGAGRDGRSAPAGMYFVRVKTEGAQWTRPVVRIW